MNSKSVLVVLATFFTCTGCPVHAESTSPQFSNPLNITNSYFPFNVGEKRVLIGTEHGIKTREIAHFTDETRDFTVATNKYACRVLVEESYANDFLKERSYNYFAQADDGTVYYFGEVVNNFDPQGQIANHNGSWLVGGSKLAGDPPASEVGNAPAPAMFMPANPRLGDQFKPEDLYPIVDETGLIAEVDLELKLPIGNVKDVIAVQESSRLSAGTETKYYARGIGIVQVKMGDEYLKVQEIQKP